jgi:hypothetical protein
LAEQAGASKTPAAPPAPGKHASAGPPAGVGAPPIADSGRGVRDGAVRGQRDGREMPPVGFATLVQSILTQAMLYLGELAVRGGEPMLDLDMAKRQLDTLAMLEEKTKGNLTAEEQRLLDSVLYDLRQRFISVASQFIM